MLLSGDREEDPFACFGDNDEDEGDEIVAGTSPAAMEEMTESSSFVVPPSSLRDADVDADSTAAARGSDDVVVPRDDDDDDRATSPRCDPWSDLVVPETTRPLYEHPALIVASTTSSGGGRRHVAARDLAPGTLLLVEAPVFVWPPEAIGRPLDIGSVRLLVDAVEDDAVLGALERLHPTKAAVDDQNDEHHDESVAGMIRWARRRYGGTEAMRVSSAAASGRSSSDGTPLTETDLLRLLLVLRYNAFDSGLYLRFSLFDHDCDPNCVKFSPEGSKNDELGRCSEVRTTRYVARGEPLTLHYLNPREVSHATRRRRLAEQHLFDVGVPSPGDAVHAFEVVGGAVPPSSAVFPTSPDYDENADDDDDDDDDDALTSRFERRAEALEDRRRRTTDHEELDVLAADAATLAREVRDALGGRHVLAARALKLLVDAARAVDDAPAVLESAYPLLETQLSYLGPYHPDVARTYSDLADAIRDLLSGGGVERLRRLEALRRRRTSSDDADDDRRGAFTRWSKEEAACRKAFRAVERFWPRNAPAKIAEQRRSRRDGDA